jgi:ectoine hydroxylase-related dioxygenase (phytanoyl-CoA dioxygenase family)
MIIRVLNVLAMRRKGSVPIANAQDVSQAVATQGFAILPDVLRPNEIALLLESLADLESRRSRAGIRHILSHPAVAAIARDSRLLAIAQDVLGDGASPFRATLFDKSPDSNWLIPWHQDTALPLQEKRDTPGWGPWSVKEGVIYAHAPASALRQVMALRLHLDDSNEQNGPLRVLPGTHTQGILSDDAVLQLSKERQAVDCLVPSGGILAMRPLLVHASSKSQIETPRRVLHIEYAAAPFVADGLQLAAA